MCIAFMVTLKPSSGVFAPSVLPPHGTVNSSHDLERHSEQAISPSGRHVVRWRSLASLLTLGLFVAALVALGRLLGQLRFDAVIESMRSYDFRHIFLAVACTAGSYLTLGVIERLALRYVNRSHDVPRIVTMATAFVAHSVSQSIGLALLTGAAVRLRSYGRRALDAVTVARVSGFVTLTVTLGLFGMGAAALLASSAPVRIGSLTASVKPLGAVIGLVVVAYLSWCASGRGGSGRRLKFLVRPTLATATAQVTLASLDWLLTGTVLFALMPIPEMMGYVELLRVYLIAQTVAVASHVPGGIGVFELIVLTLRPVGAPAQRVALVAALLMFRIVYYVVPLVMALVLASVNEWRSRGAARVASAVVVA